MLLIKMNDFFKTSLKTKLLAMMVKRRVLDVSVVARLLIGPAVGLRAIIIVVIPQAHIVLDA